jgi:hypothetical protein
VRPRALAVFKLTINSKVVGCPMGRSAGFAPLQDAVHVRRGLAIYVIWMCSIGDEGTGLGPVGRGRHHWKSMPGYQFHNLANVQRDARVVPDDDCCVALFHDAGEHTGQFIDVIKCDIVKSEAEVLRRVIGRLLIGGEDSWMPHQPFHAGHQLGSSRQSAPPLSRVTCALPEQARGLGHEGLGFGPEHLRALLCLLGLLSCPCSLPGILRLDPGDSA